MTIIAKFEWVNKSVGIGEQIIYRRFDNGTVDIVSSISSGSRAFTEDLTSTDPRPENVTYQVSSRHTLGTGEVIEKISDELTLEVPPAIPEVNDLDTVSFGRIMSGGATHYAGINYDYIFKSPNKTTSFNADLFKLVINGMVMDATCVIGSSDTGATFTFNAVHFPVMKQPIADGGWEYTIQYDGVDLGTFARVSRPVAEMTIEANAGGSIFGTYGLYGGNGLMFIDDDRNPLIDHYALISDSSIDYAYTVAGEYKVLVYTTLTPRIFHIFGEGLLDIKHVESNQIIFSGLRFYSPFSSGYRSTNLFKLSMPELPWWFTTTNGMLSQTYINEIYFKVHSGITDMSSMFERNTNGWNGDMSDWDTSNVTNLTSFMASNSSLAGYGMGKWDVSKVASLVYFCYNNKYTYTTEVDPLNEIGHWQLPALTSAARAFESSTRLPDISDWYVPNLTNVSYMFSNHKTFNFPIGKWALKKVSVMHWLFQGATAFNQDMSDWDVVNSTAFNMVFSGATSFNKPLNTWNVSNATTFQEMFKQATSFNQNINSWDISKTATFTSMFYGATAYNQPMDKWSPQSATAMNGMFYLATSFTQDISMWCVPKILKRPDSFSPRSSASTGLAKDPMWGTCPLRDIDGYGFSFRIKPGTTFVGMTDAAGSIYVNGVLAESSTITVETDSYLTVSSITATSGTLRVSGDVDEWFKYPETDPGVSRLIFEESNITKVPAQKPAYLTDMSNMFSTCPLFNQNINDWDVSMVTSLARCFYDAAIFNQPLDKWDVRNVKSMLRCFQRALAFNQNINSWVTTSLLDMGFLFNGTLAYDQPMDKWITSTVTEMPDVFSSCIFNHPVGMWDTSNVTNIKGIFYYNEVFNQNINDWDTRKFTSIANAFTYALAYDQPMDKWDVGNVTTMAFVFQNARSFSHDISMWNVSKVVLMQSAFFNTYKFNQDLAPWNVESATNMANMFQGSAMRYPLNTWCVPLILTRPTEFSPMLDIDEPFWGTCPLKNVDDDETHLLLKAGALTTMTLGADDKVFMNDVEMAKTIQGTQATAQFTSATGILRIKHVGSRPENTITVDSAGIAEVMKFAKVNQGVESFRFTANTTPLTTLRSIPDKLPTYITSTDYMFAGQATFNLDAVADWDMSKVTDASYMFMNCSSFNIDLTGYNLKALSNLEGFLYGCSSYNQPLGGLLFGTQTYNLKYMLAGCSSFTQTIEDIKVTPNDVTGMLSGCALFNSPVVKFDFSKVTSYKELFLNCTSFNQPVAGMPTYAILSFASMFKGCTKFNQSVASWYGKQNPDVIKTTAIDYGNMFYDCIAYNQPMPEWWVAAGSNMVAMFYNTKSFNQDLSNWHVRYHLTKPVNFSTDSALPVESHPVWRTAGFAEKPTFTVEVDDSGVISFDIEGMAAIDWGVKARTEYSEKTTVTYTYPSAGTYRIRLHPLPDIEPTFITSATPITTVNQWGSYIWESIQVGNAKLAAVPQTAPLCASYNNLLANSTIFNQSINSWVIPEYTTMMVSMLQNCAAYNQPMNNWNVGNVTMFMSMFSGCSAFNQDIGNWNMTSAINLMAMFENAVKFNKSLNNWAFTKVESIQYMFSGATTYNQPMNNWNVSSIRYFSGLFNNASAFNQPLNLWDTSAGISFVKMFASATSFNSSVSSFTFTNNVTCENMFTGAVKFNQDISVWDTLHITVMTGMFNGASAFKQDLSVWRVPKILDRPSDFATSLPVYNEPAWRSDPKLYPPLIYTAKIDITATEVLNKLLRNNLAAVDYGDGTRDLYLDKGGAISKTYAEAGTYTVKVHFRADVVYKINIQNWAQYAETIIQWPAADLVSAFSINSPKLIKVPDEGPKHASWSSLFTGCTIFNQDIGNWDASHVTTMSNMFYGCTAFNQNLNNWDTSNVLTMLYTFQNCESYNQPMDKWDVSKVTSMSYMFYKCTAFNGDISTWKPSSCTSFYYTFYSCTSLDQNLSGWDVSSATEFRQMFMNCSKFNSPIGTWDMSSAEQLGGMLQNCSMFNQPLGDWDVSNAKSLSSLFNNASKFNQYIGKWDVRNVTNFSSMFASALAYNQPMDGWITSSAINMRSMFSSIPVFDQPVSHFDFSNVTDVAMMFNGCSVFNQDFAGITLPKAETINAMFYNCKLFNGRVERLCGPTVTDIGAIFSGCSVFNQPVTYWDTSNVTSMPQVFKGTIFNYPLSHFNVGKCTYFGELFSGNVVFNQDITMWDVRLGTNFNSMFYYAESFTYDLSKWCVPLVTSVNANFSKGSGLTAEQLPVWGTCPNG